MFKPAPDWVDAFPADGEIEQRRLPPARPRTRKSPPEQVSRPTHASEPTLRPDPPVFAIEPAPEPKPGQETATEAEPQRAIILSDLTISAMESRLKTSASSPASPATRKAGPREPRA